MRSSTVLHRVKRGERIEGKPKRAIRTTTPPGWDPESTEAYAQAFKTWRTGQQIVQ